MTTELRTVEPAAEPSAAIEPLRAKRILFAYENHPLSTTTARAVPRLLAQVAAHFASTDPTTEIIAVSPRAEKIEGVRCVSADLNFAARARCRVTGSRLARAFGRGGRIESTIPYQLGRQALGQFKGIADDDMIVVASTLTVAILAKQILPRARVVYWIQSMPRLGQEIVAARAVASADAIIAPSKALYADLFRLICRNQFAPPVWVIPNSTDQSQFKLLTPEKIAAVRHRIGLGDEDVGVMHVGRTPEKGLQIAKAAFALGRFEKNTVLVTIGGSKKERVRIHDRAEVLQLGWISLEELNEVYQVCELGLVPSVWWENCPMALIEMMSLGICPIASGVGGIPEMIEHGKNGLIVDAPNDPRQWASAMEVLLGDDDLRGKLGREAMATAQRQFDRQEFLARFRHVLNTVMVIA